MDRHDEDPFAVKSPYSRLGASASQLERTLGSRGVDMDFNVTLAVHLCRPRAFKQPRNLASKTKRATYPLTRQIKQFLDVVPQDPLALFVADRLRMFSE